MKVSVCVKFGSLVLASLIWIILLSPFDAFRVQNTQLLDSSIIGKSQLDSLSFEALLTKGGSQHSSIANIVAPGGQLSTIWTECTEAHPFLRGCTDGSLKEDQFNTWLAQDYHFVKIFRHFVVEGVYTKAPEADKEVIRGGIEALNDELEWFQDKAKERGIENLEDVAILDANIQYMNFLNELIEKESYKMLAAAFWAIEAVYQVAWAKVLKNGVDEYQPFAARWGNDGFGEYVSLLENQMNNSFENSTQKEQDHGVALVRRICELECGFWQMAFSA
mmetsp:Transcript_27572/g.35820  ORF Transcript_27572/g.35820 Transcript_27572/m.35820 type:complete len:277 (-) Transcript_27572:150-980(-)|eukprot:CAMPEP_0117746924 /NCGR_PEP_ID=MMETSP0947-20121206/8219_1 /TAXON_ID=44440 /ORGANISM="Chattonella subsalsa, Strain CCMP2191" /LENGTH=276 /DNA_ID=CAMNT_0005564307 /DNA_START=46 /DNA_END=876 /DNA_ORIENTATION=+